MIDRKLSSSIIIRMPEIQKTVVHSNACYNGWQHNISTIWSLLKVIKFSTGLHIVVQENGWMQNKLMSQKDKEETSRRNTALSSSSCFGQLIVNGVVNWQARIPGVFNFNATNPWYTHQQAIERKYTKYFCLVDVWKRTYNYIYGKIRWPSNELMCLSILQSWNMISPEIVIKSFINIICVGQATKIKLKQKLKQSEPSDF